MTTTTTTHIYCCKTDATGNIAQAKEYKSWCKNDSIKKYKFCGVCEFFFLGNTSELKLGQFTRHYPKCRKPKNYAPQRGDLRRRAVRNIAEGEPVADGYYFLGEAKSDEEYINAADQLFLLEQDALGESHGESQRESHSESPVNRKYTAREPLVNRW